MSVYFDESELRKNDVPEVIPEHERVLELQTKNAKDWLYKLIDMMTLEQRYQLLDYAQNLLSHEVKPDTKSQAEKINVLQAIEEAAKAPNNEPIADIIYSVMKRK